MPDTVMIQEGKYNNAAYIIVEGVARMETQVRSKQSPKDETEQQRSQRIINKKQQSAKKLKIGLKTEKQWVGEDCLIIGYGQPFLFSVIAQTRVQALEF